MKPYEQNPLDRRALWMRVYAAALAHYLSRYSESQYGPRGAANAAAQDADRAVALFNERLDGALR